MFKKEDLLLVASIIILIVSLFLEDFFQRGLILAVVITFIYRSKVGENKEFPTSTVEKIIISVLFAAGILMHSVDIGLELIFLFFTAGLLVSGLIGNMEETVNMKYKITYICFITILLLRQMLLVL